MDVSRARVGGEMPLDRVPGFRIIGVLGYGASGSVFEAIRSSTGERVALKVMRNLDGSKLERFQREAGLHMELDHPIIVEARAWGIIDARSGWIAFERLYGGDLSKYIHAPDLSFEGRLEVLAAVAEALHHGHERGVIHRDVKPHNIFITRDGQPRLLDFGVAKLVEHPLTASGRILGTPGYLAPEYILEMPVDRRADVFGLGVTAYEVLSGLRPWSADEAHTLLVRICTVAPRRFETVTSESPVPIPEEATARLSAIIHRAIAHDPKHRYSTAQALGEAFRDLLVGHDTVTMTRPTPVVEASRLEWARARAARIEHEGRSREPEVASLSDALTLDRVLTSSHQAFWALVVLTSAFFALAAGVLLRWPN
ncbi:MAG: serine/threonine-protein kinase [Myxococcota bacterium]